MERAWEILVTSKGVRVWLGEVTDPNWAVGATYELGDGTTGEIRVFKPNSHLRVTYFPPDWPRASTIQVRVIPSGVKTQISFHQEHLPGPSEREERKQHFHAAHDRIGRLVEAG